MHVTVRDTRRIDVGTISRIGLGLSLTSLLLVAAGSSVKDATALNETRTLSFHHTHSGEDLTVTFKRNGRYDEEALKKLNHHLRDWRSQDSTTMDRRLFDILWEVYRDVDGKQPINIISAYRSPQTNAMLRRRSSGVARFSQHMRGHAIDFFIPGASLSEIRAAGLRLQRGGVGFYPTSGSPFVHLDTGSVRHWPRMTHDQLAAVFPNGRTVHIPSDGNPLKGYDLAAADIERREKNGDITSTRGSKSFLASLFSSKSNDEEDEAPANEAASPKEQKVAQAAAPAKSENVPLPRMRPGGSYQVASASSQPAEAKPQTVADIINSRGFWGDDAPPPKQATQVQAAALAARAAVGDPQATASVTPAGAQQALAYAPAALLDRSKVVAASAPIPRSIRPVNAGANPMATASTVVMKGLQPAPPMVTVRATSATSGNEVWLRAMVLAPNSYRFMLPTVIGEPDMTSLRAQFVKPEMVIAARFADDATPGLRSDHFTGSAFATLPKVSFRVQTASLR